MVLEIYVDKLIVTWNFFSVYFIGFKIPQDKAMCLGIMEDILVSKASEKYFGKRSYMIESV